MPRTEARIRMAIWRNADFKALAMEAQWLYFAVLSQPRLSYCGVLPWNGRQLAKLAANLSADVVDQALRYLEFGQFVVIDRESEELWVRTFVRHDGILEQPNMIRAMAKDFVGIDSAPIAAAFLEGLGEGFLEGLPRRFPKGFGEGCREPLDQGFVDAFREHFFLPNGGPFPEGSGEGEGEISKNEKKKDKRTLAVIPETRALADTLVKDWWESQDPPPPNSFIGVRDVVARLLQSGADPRDVRQALDEAPMPTLNALQFAMSKRPTSHNGRIITERESDAQVSVPADWESE